MAFPAIRGGRGGINEGRKLTVPQQWMRRQRRRKDPRCTAESSAIWPPPIVVGEGPGCAEGPIEGTIHSPRVPPLCADRGKRGETAPSAQAAGADEVCRRGASVARPRNKQNGRPSIQGPGDPSPRSRRLRCWCGPGRGLNQSAPRSPVKSPPGQGGGASPLRSGKCCWCGAQEESPDCEAPGPARWPPPDPRAV